MQIINCPLCGSETWTALFHEQPMLNLPAYHYVRCDSCRLAYLNPQPTQDELAAYYTESYDSFQHASLRRSWGRRWLVRHGFRQRQRLIEHYKRGGELLEIGCADGSFLHLLQHSGRWRVTGVETSAAAVRIAHETYGLELIHSQIEQADLPRGSFDVVAMWDVLEHLPQPLSALSEVRALLKPDGMLVLRLPLRDGWDARRFGHYWAGWDAPHHLTVWSEAQLERILTESGLEIQHGAGIASSLSCLAPTLRRCAAEHATPAGRALVTLVGAAPFQVLLAPLSWLVARLWPVSCRLVIARPTHDVPATEIKTCAS